MLVRRIISGGQTGVDRGALAAAMELGLEHGGWCPRGRRAEDGRIPDEFVLCEHVSPAYAARTEQNVLESDATLILARGALTGGTRLTQRLALRHGKACLVVEVDDPRAESAIRAWLDEQPAQVLNVAGPRESQAPGIGAATYKLLTQVFRPAQAPGDSMD